MSVTPVARMMPVNEDEGEGVFSEYGIRMSGMGARREEEDVDERISGADGDGDGDGDMNDGVAGGGGSLYVAWTATSTSRSSSPSRGGDPDGLRPQRAVDIDAIVVSGLADTASSQRRRQQQQRSHSREPPLTWLCDYLDRPGTDSRILHFEYDPSEILSPRLAYHGIGALAEDLLDKLVKLRAAGGTNRRIVFFGFDIGCVVVKKALTIAARTESVHGEIFDACRTLVFFDCPHRSKNALEMQNKLAGPYHERSWSPSSQFWPSVTALPGLAASILDVNESFIASKFLLRSFLISVHSDDTLAFEAWRELEHHSGTLGVPWEWRIFCYRPTNLFVSHLLDSLRELERKPTLRMEESLTAQLPRLPFDGERALLSLAQHTEPFTVAGHYGARIELSDVYAQWLDYPGTQILHVYSGKDNRELVRQTSEQVFYRLADEKHVGTRLLLDLYYSFDVADVRARSLSSMLWTFLSQIVSQFREIRHYVPFLLDRLYGEQACTEADLLGWLEFFIARFDDIRLVVNYFDDCPDKSRLAFIRLVRRIAKKSDRPMKVFLTSRKPATLQAELSEWPSIDLDRGVNPLERRATETQLKGGAAQEQKLTLLSGTPPENLAREIAQSPLTTPVVPETVDALAKSILLEQQLQRNLTTREILQESTRGPLEAYTLETILDRILRSIPDQRQARVAIAFLQSATRPLSTREFATLLFLGSAVDDGEAGFPLWDLFERFERERRAWFAGITVNKHSGIHLAHPRLEEVLRKPESPDSPRYFWHEVASTAHYDMACICLSYLARGRVKEEQVTLFEKSFIVDTDLGFISYAVRFWPYHFSLALSTSTEEQIKDLRQKMAEVDLNTWSKTLWLLSNPFSRSRNPWASPLIALTSLGYPAIIQPSNPSDIAFAIEELARTGNSDLVRSIIKTPKGKALPYSVLVETIVAASSSGDEDLALNVLDRVLHDGADEILKRGTTLLFRAARLGLPRLAKRLLEIGVSVCPEIAYTRGTFTTPLCVAAVAGHISVVEVLLENGDNTEFQSHLQRTPLSLAASQGNVDVVECLAKKGKANIEHVDGGDDIRKQTPLLIACEWGNPLVVEKLIELGVDPKKPDSNGWAPIIVAATFGYSRILRTLLDNGVDIETPGPGGHGTALRYALANGHVEVFRMLLRRGANPGSPAFINPLLYDLVSDRLPMTIGNRIALAKLLLEEHQVDVNATSSKGRTALARACASSQTRFADFLLRYEADVNLADKDGYTPLFEAAETQNLYLVEVLLDKGADANMRNSKGEIPLHMCRQSRDLTRMLAERTEDVDLPLSGGSGGVTPLMAAASKGWTQSVKVLLEHKAKVNAVVTSDDEDRWPGWTPVMFAAFFHYPDILMILAEQGADLMKSDKNGASALHLIFSSPASETGSEELECLDVLLEFHTRVNLDKADEDGETVLHRCARRSHLRAVQKLVRAGANVNLQDKYGSTPLGVAVWEIRRDVISYLLGQAAADPNIAGEDLKHKEGPLHRACRDSEYEIAKMLIEHGADINRDSVSGHGTPLMAVCLPYSKHLKDTDKLIHYLLDLGADVNTKSRYVGSPLAAAALACRPEIVRVLLERGAEYDGKDGLRRKPIHFAALNGEKNFKIIEEKVGGDLVELDVLGRTALHYAAQGGRLQTVQRIFETLPDTNVNTRDIDGWTPLCWVARGTTSWLSEDRASEPTDPVGVVRYLLDRGADRSVSCKIGDKDWTALQIAEYTGSPDDVIALLKDEQESELPKSEGGETTRDTDDVKRPKGLAIEGVTCDACLWEIRGIYHMCKVCCDFALCEKCWVHRDIAHFFEMAHDFELVDEEAEYNASRIIREGSSRVVTMVLPGPSMLSLPKNNDNELSAQYSPL
ncbi:ankyrin repeat-containing domain protein [Xylaria arbuscula]|nr:ankyrin repeat-containing domain protein [Xylaria arbuscula]